MQTYLNAPINGINKSSVLAVHNLQFFFLNNEVCVLVSEVLVWFFFTSYIWYVVWRTIPIKLLYLVENQSMFFLIESGLCQKFCKHEWFF
jgi:hypothetical protein